MRRVSREWSTSTRRWISAASALLVACIAWSGKATADEPAQSTKPAASRPNILWISCEDMSPDLGCYGAQDARTPNLDRFAHEAVRFTRAFSVAGVCAPSRSAMITGLYSTSLGSHPMRCTTVLPSDVQCFPSYLRQGGYYCTNNSKEDYNFRTPQGVWDASNGRAHYRNRRPGQPFFAVFNLTTTHESQIRLGNEQFARRTAALRPDQRHRPDDIFVPPWHPDTSVIRRDWANYHDLVTAMDHQVGELLAELEASGEADDTIVFFWSDHGVGLPRGKRWLYDSGIRVPLLVRFPANFRESAPDRAGSTSDRLVSLLDLGPTVLSLCGVQAPEAMQGQAFLGTQAVGKRRYVHGIRDRMDERTDMTRAVRDGRYKYIRNFMPHLPYSQRLSYMELMPAMAEWRRLAAADELEGPAAHFMQPRKPVEELYDTEADPHEIHNLADAPEHRETLERLRGELRRWMRQTRDLGLMPEAELRRQSAGSSPREMGQKLQDGIYDVWLQAAWLVTTTDEHRSQQFELLEHEDPVVRYWAVMGLAASGSAEPRNPRPEIKEVVEALREALADESANVRLAAADGLGRLNQFEAALPVVEAGLKDKDEWVRHAAIEVADRWGTQAASLEPLIVQAAKDSNEYVRRVAEHLLGEFGSRPANKAEQSQ